MLAEILSDTLSDRNFDVHLAYDGIHALEAIKKEPFDVIVSDVMMPNLDGYSLAKKLRTRDAILQYYSLRHYLQPRMLLRDLKLEVTTS